MPAHLNLVVGCLGADRGWPTLVCPFQQQTSRRAIVSRGDGSHGVAKLNGQAWADSGDVMRCPTMSIHLQD